MPPLQRYVIALTGGLQDSKAIPEPGDLTKLYNFALFRGRFALRAPVEEVADLSTVAAGNDSDEVLDMETHLNKVFILGYESVANIVKLYKMDLDGSNLVWLTNVWTGVTSIPTVRITSFSGGTAEAPQDRLYIADYDQLKATQYWVDSTTTLTAVSEDWNADSTSTGAAFSLLAPFQFHLWGSGFFQGLTAGTLRPELLRFSQPGLIEGTDPAGGANPKEWYTLSHRSVGRRGDKIKAISYARGQMIVFQTRSTHAIFGYGSDSWATKQLSDNIGCVGPNAATSTDADGLCFFWSHDGPYVTDGQTVTDIGEDIRQRVLDIDSNDSISAAYSPDDGMVYFIVPKPAAPADPYLYLAYDTKNQRWVEGEWTTGVGNHISVSTAKTISSREILLAPGPTAPPSNFSINAACSLCNTEPGKLRVQLGWTAGDYAIDGTTELYRDTTPSPTTVHATYTGGVNALYDEDSVAHDTFYYYRVRHIRNGIPSAYSADASGRTPLPWLNALTGTTRRLSAVSAATGVKLDFDNPTLNAEIRIERSNADNINPDEILWAQGYTTSLSFGPVTVLANQAVGALTYTDTTTTAGRSYIYRARLEETAKISGGWSESNAVVAQGGTAGADPTVTASNLFLSDSGAGYMAINATYSTTNFVFDVDEIRLYVGWDGAYGSIPNAVYRRDLGRWKYIWACPHPDGYTTIKVKWEAWKNGTRLTSTSESNVVTPCSGIVY